MIEIVEVPSLQEIRDVIVEYVQATEPMTNTLGVASVVHGFLVARAIARPPEHELSAHCWCNPAVERVGQHLRTTIDDALAATSWDEAQAILSGCVGGPVPEREGKT